MKSSSGKYMKFVNALLTDIEALELMIKSDLFENNIQRIGAEQEICIVNKEWKPADNAIQILAELNHNSFTTELAKYNIEINLEPLELKAGCFGKMESNLLEKLKLAYAIAEQFNSKLVLAGILPTISRNEITLEYLTPIQRYHDLSKKLRNLRGRKFDLYLKGVDEIHIRHDSIMFEACNTSFQSHLQIAPDDFVPAYNWAAAISAPVLAIASNSPLLLGKELWSEIRIALFQQSIDTRHSVDEIREQRPRVTFGKDWVYKSITEIYKEDISRFEILITDAIKENSLECLKENKIPQLHALRMHNGTIYRWNRMCYGITNNVPHMRIENRYVPAGPTVQDEIANTAFWVGLMKAMPAETKNIWDHFEFKDIKSNFFKAARAGIESVFVWKDQQISAKRLIEQELLPMAHSGLKSCGLTDAEIFIYLGRIEKRLKTQTGAQWQVKNFRKLKKEINESDAVKIITEQMYNYQKNNIPVCEWRDIDIAAAVKHQISNMVKVKQLMSTDVLTAYPDDPVALVERIMQWNDINHIIIENKTGKILGVVTSGHIKELYEQQQNVDNIPAKNLMRKDILTIDPETDITEALVIMQTHWISSLPVVKNNKLCGIITKNDMLRWLATKN